MYSALPFAFSQVVIEFPYVLGQALIYSTIFYPMASFEWTALKFIWYMSFMYFTMLYFTFWLSIISFVVVVSLSVLPVMMLDLCWFLMRYNLPGKQILSY